MDGWLGMVGKELVGSENQNGRTDLTQLVGYCANKRRLAMDLGKRAA